MLCASPRTVEKWLTLGSLPCGRKWPGRHRIIRTADLVAFADRNGMASLIDAAGLRREGGGGGAG